MNKQRIRSVLFFILALLPVSAFAQNVQQSGLVTRNHVPYWVTSGVIGDGGSSTDSPISSIGVTNNGGAGICVSSDRQSAAGRNQLCFGAQTNGAATISLQNYGTATPQGLNFVINGTIVNVPTGGGTFIFGNGPFTVGDVPCFSTTAGVVIDCGLAVSAGTITSGVWNGTTIGLNAGGTGATSAAGARTSLGLGTIATQNSNAVAITGGTITGMPSPSTSSDVATKSYVDANASGLNILASSALATAAVLPNTPTYANGASGVGATLTAGSNTTLTVDGTAAPLNTVVLVKNQASAFQNGIYTVTTAGSGAAPWVLTRATYFDQAAEMKAGSYTFITAGATLINSSWTLQTAVTTVGTDALTWAQFSSGSSGTVTSAQISAGTGINVSGTCTITSAGNCQVAVSGSINANTLNSQTTDYTIQTSDCSKTVQAGTGSTGQFTITLPAVAGFDSACQINVHNGDTAAGKKLSGFPTSMTSPNILWPLQNTTLRIVNGVWTATNPGRWKNPGQQTVHVDKTNGDNTNDGLASGAGRAVQDAQTAYSNIFNLFDTQNTTPIIAMACAQTHTVPLQMGGTILGSNLVQLSPDGNCAYTWLTTTSSIVVSDLAELDINSTFYGASGVMNIRGNTNNAASNGSIYLHNAVVIDMEGTPVWTPGGSNDNFFFCDGPCEATIANGVTQAGGGGANYVVNMSEGGKITQSGTISASGAGGLAGGVWNIFGGALFIAGGATGGGWSSIGASKVYAHGTVITNGITPNGGYSVGTSGVGCTSLTSSC